MSASRWFATESHRKDLFANHQYNDSVRPGCPTCKCPMDDIFRGSDCGSIAEDELWHCARCGFERPKYLKAPETPKTTISFSKPSKSTDSKPVPIDETKHFDRLKPAQKIAKLFDRGRETAQIWCPTCSKWKTTIPSKSGKKTCPVCKYSESQESQTESRSANN